MRADSSLIYELLDLIGKIKDIILRHWSVRILIVQRSANSVADRDGNLTYPALNGTGFWGDCVDMGRVLQYLPRPAPLPFLMAEFLAKNVATSQLAYSEWSTPPTDLLVLLQRDLVT
ncbi:hypothetical protein PIB30_051731 [Stylosanthes scabra]|uniref:RNase H type-1 domain-containing protein n=1 Tax=Stylosanthes scabra TaxID=79078 RepID=A0ABU6SIU6_9FABA|nr:hypothetical protein [Stylosanthes scabra]